MADLVQKQTVLVRKLTAEGKNMQQILKAVKAKLGKGVMPAFVKSVQTGTGGAPKAEKAPEVKKAGRPKKKAAAKKVGRPRGRPGRPKKAVVAKKAAAVKKVGRPRGRPRMTETAQGEAVKKVGRPRGRPKKAGRPQGRPGRPRKAVAPKAVVGGSPAAIVRDIRDGAYTYFPTRAAALADIQKRVESGKAYRELVVYTTSILKVVAKASI